MRSVLWSVLGCDQRHGAHLRLSLDDFISLFGIDLEILETLFVSDLKYLYLNRNLLKKSLLNPDTSF